MSPSKESKTEKDTLSAQKYRQILHYLVAVEKAEGSYHSILTSLKGLVDYDGAQYIAMGPDGSLDEVFAVGSESVSAKDLMEDRLVRKDPVFDLGDRSSGMGGREVRVETNLSGSDPYRKELEKLGICHALAFSFGASGESIRLFRTEKENPFTEPEVEILRVVSDMLFQLLPGYKATRTLRQEQLVDRILGKKLPFGTLVFDEKFRLLQNNDIAFTRMSEISGERDKEKMVEAYVAIMKRQIEEMKASRELSTTDVVSEKYIVETIILGEMNGEGRLTTYYVSLLYAKEWFRVFLIQSADALMRQYQLTNREQEIVGFVLRGLSTKEIAETLFISANTVKEHFRSIFHKMEVRNRGELIIKVYTTQL